ncbi:hypothetical protein ACSSS7_005402 [Eimeria intestinalis]
MEAMRFLDSHGKKFGFLFRLKRFRRARTTSNSSSSNSTLNDRSSLLNRRIDVSDGDIRSDRDRLRDTREESGEEDECGETEIVKDATSVSYIRCGKVLKIHKSKCGTVPTFDYVSQSPYAVLLAPLSETRRSARKRQATEGTEAHANINKEELRKRGWTVADAVWAFRPTTGTKLWAVNTVAAPLRHEPLLSRDPDARMHRGYRAFFHMTLKSLIDDFIAKLTETEENNATGVFTVDGSRSNKDKNLDDIRERFFRGTEGEPFTVIFAGLSVGGATAGIASIYFVREMKKKGLDKQLRVMCVSFGAPSVSLSRMTRTLRKGYFSQVV